MQHIVPELLFIGIPCFLIAALCVALFYEVMAHVWMLLPRYEGRPRIQIFITVFGIFLAHTLCIWLFGVSFYTMEHLLHLGKLIGSHNEDLVAYIYFTASTYTTVGFGDLYPSGALRMLSSVAALTGLLLIGWSVAFTYVMTDRYLVHKSARKRPPTA